MEIFEYHPQRVKITPRRRLREVVHYLFSEKWIKIKHERKKTSRKSSDYFFQEDESIRTL